MGEGGGDGATVGAVVGVFGCGEVEEELFHFGSAEGVSGFDGHFAGGHDPDLFSRWDDAFVHGRFDEFVDEVGEVFDRVFAFEGGGNGADDE